jgi:hypothetical protein
MKVTFAIWGALGLIVNTGYLLFISNIGSSSYACAMSLVWIGGMLFFGLGSLPHMRESRATGNEANDVLRRVRASEPLRYRE